MAEENKDAPNPCESTGEGDTIKVFLRVRPPMKDEDTSKQCLEVNSEGNTVVLKSKPDPRFFTFDQVADIHAAQETIFSAVGKKIIESCLAGYNGTIFAYGQTGSGKTYTMLGPADNADNFQHELRGVIPRSFEYLFNQIKREQDLHGDKVQFLCKCSFLEIYNEQVFDLLDAGNRGLQMRENIKYGVFVDGLIEESVSSAAEAYNVLSSGWMNRTVASTSMNRESSRSHAVFTVHLESKEMQNGVWNVRTSNLNLVDLAGSERQKDTNTVGVRLKEAGSINKSLSVLGNVIMALVDITTHGKTRHVPYRESKLSFLLRDSLGGNAKTTIIACVHPGYRSLGETLSTLQFAQRAKMIKNKAVRNEDAQGSVVHLQEEIRRLKETLQQMATSTIPQELGSVSAEGTGDYKKWRQNFLDAMLFCEDKDNKCKKLSEQINKLKTTLEHRDKSYQQTRLIIKFREEALKKYDRAFKEKDSLISDEKNDVIKCLRGEVKALQEINDHHPDLMRYKADNDALRKEIKRQQAQLSKGDVLNDKRISELELMYEELQASKPKDGVIIYSTPKAGGSNMPVATVERQKSQITKLHEELATERRTLNEMRTELSQQLLESEAANKSLKVTKEELVKRLEAHQTRSRVEREQMSTPKTGYLLRNRTVLVPGSCGPDIESEEGVENDLIENEQMPQEVMWTEEINNLQSQIEYLKTQLDTRDADIIHQVEERSKYEDQYSTIQQLRNKDLETWTEKEAKLNCEIISLSGQFDELSKNIEYKSSEICDLNLMLKQSDRQRADLGQDRDNIAKERDSLETKLLRLTTHVEELERKYQHDMDFFQQNTEGMQSELEGKNTVLKGLEEDLQDANNSNCTLTATLKEAERKVEQLGRLPDIVSSKEQQLQDYRNRMELKVCELADVVQHLEEERDSLLKKVAQQQDEAAQLSLRLTNSEQQQRDMVDHLTTQMSTLRQQADSTGHERDQLSIQVLEDSEKLEQLSAANDQLQQEHETEKHQMQAELEAQNTHIQKLDVELSMTLEDLEAARDDITGLNNERGDLELMIEQLKSQTRNLEIKMESKENECDGLHSRLMALQQQLVSVQHISQQENSELALLQHKLQVEASHSEACVTQLKNLQSSFDEIATQLGSREAEFEDCKMELDEKHVAWKEAHAQQVTLQEQCSHLHLQLELQENLNIEEAQTLQCVASMCESRASLAEEERERACLELTAITNKYNSILHEYEDFNDTICSLGLLASEKDGEITRLREALASIHDMTDDTHSKTEECRQHLLNAEQERDNYKQRYDEQVEQNAQLAGHANHKQKIYYLTKIKTEKEKAETENLTLREENLHLKSENKQLQKELSKTMNRLTPAKVYLGNKPTNMVTPTQGLKPRTPTMQKVTPVHKNTPRLDEVIYPTPMQVIHEAREKVQSANSFSPSLRNNNPASSNPVETEELMLETLQNMEFDEDDDDDVISFNPQVEAAAMAAGYSFEEDKENFPQV